MSIRLRRLGAVIATAGLLVTIVPGAALARDTRDLYVGDPSQATNSPDAFEIHPTYVSPGNTTYFDVLIKNRGRQTLTGATLGMGTLIASTDGTNIGQALPVGWKINDVQYLSGITPTCVTDPASAAPASGLITAGSYDGFACSYGNLARNDGGSVRVYLTAGPSLDFSSDIQVSGQVAENVGGNVGSNTNTYYAYGTGTFFFSGDGVIAGLFAGGSKIKPSTDGAVDTEIDLGAVTSSTVVYIDETGDPADSPCPLPAVSNCTDGVSVASVNGGQAVSPYYLWTAIFDVPDDFKLNKDTAVIHFYETGGYEILYNTPQTSCSHPKSKIPCADFSVIDVGGDLFLQVIAKLTKNGTLRGGW